MPRLALTILAVANMAGASSDAAADLAHAPLGEIVFAARPYGPDGHYYANFGYYCQDPNRKAYPVGGRLCRFDPTTGKTAVLLDDPKGGIRDPQVHYDGRKLIFSWRKGGADHYHLYEMNVDGTSPRQLTDGPFDDIEPTYLPDGGIAFCSSRCNRWVMCWKVPVAILYRCDADGGSVRPLSSNAVTENTPAVLPDGRILYTRWEYVNRSQLAYHHLWTVNPDGTGQMTFYGNMHPIGKAHQIARRQGKRVQYSNVAGSVAMLDARPVPGTREIIASFSPGHGRREHAGFLTLVDPDLGPDASRAARRIHPSGGWRDPWPVTRDTFLAAKGREVFLISRAGETRSVCKLDGLPKGWDVHEPRPLRPRPREKIPAPRDDRREPTGRLILANAAVGRNMAGVAPGDIRKLLALEQLPGPFHVSPGFDGISLWGEFTLTRILGTVGVEADGSAHFEAPALRSLHFVALDANDISIKHMQSFVTLQPGETAGCVGCHEPRTSAPANAHAAALRALRRPPSRIQPIAGAPEIVDFARHIQPILDAHCVRCHGGAKTEDGLSLTADGNLPSHGRGRVNRSYVALVSRLGEIVDGRNAHGNRSPRSFGSAASRLMGQVSGSHYGVRATARERMLVRLWLDSGAVANGTYAIMDGGTPDAPSPLYVREMKRYGILSPGFDAARHRLDVYKTDQAYWRSFWYRLERKAGR